MIFAFTFTLFSPDGLNTKLGRLIDNDLYCTVFRVALLCRSIIQMKTKCLHLTEISTNPFHQLVNVLCILPIFLALKSIIDRRDLCSTEEKLCYGLLTPSVCQRGRSTSAEDLPSVFPCSFNKAAFLWVKKTYLR